MNRKALPPESAAADFRLVFQTLPGQCVLVSPDHPRFTVVDASDAYLRAVRQSRDAMVGRGLFEVFPEGPDEAHARTIRNLRASFGRVLTTRKPHTLPVAQQYDLQDSSRLQPAFEERHWMLVSSPVLDETGAVRFILHQIENVTERVVAEMGRRESEEHLRYTVELSTLVPWTADPQGRILDFSDKWLELTGLTREAALGHGWAQVPHPHDRPRMIAAWIHSISTGEPYDIEHRIQLADGSYRWMHTRARPRLDDAGHILRWYGTTEDVDERTQTERRNDFLVRLDDAVRALTDPQAITQTAARMLAEHLDVTGALTQM
ncbi:MAG: sensory box histidine kinase/response regulator [Bryobacterales bacterium]|nr:sensory box histidine kinase/response regulator [Bryobacterales bacterium]